MYAETLTLTAFKSEASNKIFMVDGLLAKQIIRNSQYLLTPFMLFHFDALTHPSWIEFPKQLPPIWSLQWWMCATWTRLKITIFKSQWKSIRQGFVSNSFQYLNISPNVSISLDITQKWEMRLEIPFSKFSFKHIILSRFHLDKNMIVSYFSTDKKLNSTST